MDYFALFMLFRKNRQVHSMPRIRQSEPFWKFYTVVNLAINETFVAIMLHGKHVERDFLHVSYILRHLLDE